MSADVPSIADTRWCTARSRIAWQRAAEAGFQRRNPTSGEAMMEVVQPRLRLVPSAEAI